LNKNVTIILLIVLILIGTGAAIFYYGGTEPEAEPEVISKRIKIEVPEGPTVAHMEVAEPEPVPKPAPLPPEAPKPLVKKAPPPKKAPEKVVFKPWVVNVASFSQKKEAINFAKTVRSAGYTSYVTEVTLNGVKWHRVRVGFFKTRTEANKVGEDLSRKFKQPGAWVVKPKRGELLKHMK
jgi:cell division septation protein DedD